MSIQVTSHVLGAGVPGERAARMFRVSTGEQDTANQEPEVDAHVSAHGYAVAKTFELSDVSASKGNQEPALAEILADIKAGLYTVVVIAHSSRLDRRDPEMQEMWSLLVSGAGGRIESAREPEFGKRTLPGRIMTLLAQDANYTYTKTLSEHTRAGQHEARLRGSAVGSVPWGYVCEGARKDKQLVPTADGKRYVPEIFLRIARGESLRAVAAWLDSTDATPGTKNHKHEAGFSARTVQVVIRNTAYYGRKVNGEGMALDIPALVDVALWTRANDTLSRKDKSGQRGTVTQEKALLTSVLYCPDCPDSAMYRIQPQNTRKDGSKSTTAYYRCSGGKGPAGARKSCGLMLRCDATDALAAKALAKLTVKVVKIEQLPATDHETELASLRQTRKQLDDLADDYDTRYAALTAEIKELQALPTEPARTVDVPESYSYAEMAGSSDLGSKLRADKVVIYASKNEAAIQKFSDATTRQLLGGDSKKRYSLDTDGTIWLAIEYRTA